MKLIKIGSRMINLDNICLVEHYHIDDEFFGDHESGYFIEIYYSGCSNKPYIIRTNSEETYKEYLKILNGGV